jgi:predicted transcriptional regulator
LERRGWCDIVADILVTTKGGTKITDIMYSTKLSYMHMQEYLKLLKGAGLLKYEKSSRTYVTTKSGDKFLSSYKEITGLISPAGKQHSLVRA